MKVLPILVIIGFTTLLSCSPTKTNTPTPTDSLPASTPSETIQMTNLDTTWELQSQQGVTLNTDHIPQLVIHSADKSFMGIRAVTV